MHPHLERCLAIVLDATKDGGAECAVRRDPNKWSVVEVVEHLTRAYSGTAKGFERCLEKGAPLATSPSFKQTLQQFAIVKLGYFPEGRQAPKHILPTGELDLNAVLTAVRRDLARLDDAAIKTRQALGSGKMLDHPILGALTVDQWLKFHVVHSQHHAGRSPVAARFSGLPVTEMQTSAATNLRVSAKSVEGACRPAKSYRSAISLGLP